MPDTLSLSVETDRFQRFTANLVRNLEREAARRVLRTLAFEFLRRVIMKNPVDTGRSRAGWTPYLIARGQPFPAIGGRDPDAQAEGQAKGYFVEHFRGRSQFILLGNGVEYIIPLEYGWSRQAPAGMVRLTMRELQGGKDWTLAMSEELAKSIIRADRAAGSRARGR